ncbi:hypothetical protein ZYGR_0AI07790 [Zygosaccharomyces rouxii]|uniref:2-dehydropantoate 2-reductase n=1 Tax=Zygosaccharomyces rouxii TaxID=4956 RepID=A0A1Q3ACZ9_ZYGRO|nr:hypothetical protein ZYGR_0AI07790 [Zygosaccharomyces rouxii]
MTKESVLLVGSGGVGTMAAFALEYSGKAAVTSVLRSDYAKVTDKGFTIDSCDYGHVEGFKTTHIVNSVEKAKQFGPFGYIVVTTKNIPDVTDITEVIAPVVTSDSTIVLIQNGIGIERMLFKKFPKNIVLSGVSLIQSINRNGYVEHTTQDILKLGYFYNSALSKDLQESSCRKFIDLYSNEKVDCEYDEDVKFSRWRKLVYNACLNPICALTGVDVGRLELFGGIDNIIRASMREIIKIAKSDGVTLPEDVIEFMIRCDDPIYFKPSMLVDVEKQNFMEIEVICGNPLRIARENGVEVPNLSLTYALLRVVQSKLKEEKGLITVPKERPAPK